MPIGEFGNQEDHGVDQQVEVFSYFVDPDQSDKNSSMKSRVNYTTSAGIPVLKEPGSPVLFASNVSRVTYSIPYSQHYPSQS